MKRAFVSVMVLAAIACLAAPAAAAVSFPEKGRSVSILIPYAPGGGTDVSARLLAGPLEKELGIPVQIINKPGASTQVALTEMKNARPDGYTIGSFTLPTSIFTYVDRERGAVYSRKDFQPIMVYFSESNTVVVKPDSPFKTLKELVEAARTKPGQIKVGTTSLMGTGHVTWLRLEQVTGAKFRKVHYNGGAPALQAAMGGEVDAAAPGSGSALPQYKARLIRVLGLPDDRRNEFMPDVPTFKESGYNVNVPVAHGFIVPIATPKEIVQTLLEKIKKAMQNPAVQTKMKEQAMSQPFLGPEEFSKLWASLEQEVGPVLELAKQEQK